LNKDKFTETLRENYSSLSTRDLNVITSMADDMAGINVKEQYGDIERKIDIAYFCMQIEKTYLFSVRTKGM
jgi:hypothetical protein